MLALIAGNGRLPAILCETVEFSLTARIAGTSPEALAPEASLEFSLETIASFLTALKAQGITEVCFAGGTQRPVLQPDRIEAESEPYVGRLLAALAKGDDGALSILLGIFEGEGFTIRAAHELAPDLLPQKGSETRLGPSREAGSEARVGDRIMKIMGAADIGQACVIHKGQPIAIEASFGTDWMLDSLARRPDGQGGILCKAPKPSQDRRVDLPTIGPKTVTRAAAAGLTGIVIEAGGVIVVDRDEVIRRADEAGLFFWVRPV